MARTTDPDFVTGSPGRYEVQPPIVHPAFCICARCHERPAHLRSVEQTIRVRRRSPHPASRVQSAVFARALKERLEANLRDAVERRRASGKMTPRQVFDLYFAQNPRKVSEATIRRDAISARNLCRLLPPETFPEQIDDPVVIRYRNAREKELASPRTILGELSFLKMALEFGRAWETETGMEGIRYQKVPDVGDWEERGVALSIDQFAAAWEAAKPRDAQLLITGVTTLLRRKPLLGLSRGWTDLDGRWLSVPRDWMKKGKARRRSPLEVPLCDWAVETLRPLRTSAEGFYWPNPKTGQPLTWVEHIFRYLSDAAGVEFSCHDLRTTGASWLSQAKVDELVIAILLGHRSSFDAESGTMHVRGSNVTRRYTKLFETTLREAVAVFDEIRLKILRKRSALRAV